MDRGVETSRVVRAVSKSRKVGLKTKARISYTRPVSDLNHQVVFRQRSRWQLSVVFSRRELLPKPDSNQRSIVNGGFWLQTAAKACKSISRIQPSRLTSCARSGDFDAPIAASWLFGPICLDLTESGA
jgi:hypothetical protein